MRVTIESVVIRQIASFSFYFACSKPPIGLNVLFCVDRFQSTVDNTLIGSSDHVIHARHNSPMTETGLRRSTAAALCLN